jgi:hypothetical protein
MMLEGNAGGDELDEGKVTHDEVTVNLVKGQAMILAQLTLSIVVSTTEENIVLSLFSKVNTIFPSYFAIYQYILGCRVSSLVA